MLLELDQSGRRSRLSTRGLGSSPFLHEGYVD